jgi:hypothetical protein
MTSLIRFSSRRFLFTSIDLGSQLKKLNDNRQFEKTIELYEDQIKKQKKNKVLL